MKCNATTLGGKTCSRDARMGTTTCFQHNAHCTRLHPIAPAKATPFNIQTRASKAFKRSKAFDVATLNDYMGARDAARLMSLNTTHRDNSIIRRAVAEQRIVNDAGNVQCKNEILSLCPFFDIVVPGTRYAIIRAALIECNAVNVLAGRRPCLWPLVWLCLKKSREDVLRVLVNMSARWSHMWKLPHDLAAFCVYVHDLFNATLLDQLVTLLYKQPKHKRLGEMFECIHVTHPRWAFRPDVTTHVLRTMARLERENIANEVVFD